MNRTVKSTQIQVKVGKSFYQTSCVMGRMVGRMVEGWLQDTRSHQSRYSQTLVSVITDASLYSVSCSL